jgi:pimeloyl-ACP methyl ester carboxylesterase
MPGLPCAHAVWSRVRAALTLPEVRMSRSSHAAALLTLLAAAPIDSQQTYESRFLDSDGVRLHYIDEGSGEPVLLLHGLATNVGMNWVAPGLVAALVGAGYRVVAYDARGHGRSDKPHDPALYGPSDVDDAIRVLDQLGIDRAHVIGYSRGGGIASHLRVRHPERLRSLILGGFGDSGQGTGSRERLPAEVTDSLKEGRLGPLVRWLTRDITPEELALVQQASATNDMHAVAAAFQGDALHPTLTAADLDATTVPTLAVVGDLDPFREEVERMVTNVPGVEALIIPGASHIMAVGRPEFLTAVLGFLTRHGGR